MFYKLTKIKFGDDTIDYSNGDTGPAIITLDESSNNEKVVITNKKFKEMYFYNTSEKENLLNTKTD